ncbi:caspase-1-like [Anthonomus grandis grandis]|uniref:caspase-1-like n=1 Tax=Anthonomus grandis grandis TaxID=2921223 RepID=UPI00216508FD|nr:caspase-1-like [Anthonomus grandis grandis]
MDNGEDQVGNGRKEEVYHDAEDMCLNGNGFESHDGTKKIPSHNDEGDALGRPGERPGEVTAQMPVAKYATHYKMDHKHRGKALIFNHEVFSCGSLKSRSGTNEDCSNLENCLKCLGFDVEAYHNLTYAELDAKIKQVADMNHSNHDCLFVAVLSHGELGIIYAKDTAYKPESLWSRFTADQCPSLAGKPKMFFLQACQGDKLDGGVNLRSNLGRTETDGEVHHNSYKIPAQADFLIVYSTVKGYYSWRNTTKGSWFIQALCEELRHRAHHSDLLTILTFVSQRVALDFESNVPDNQSMHRQKQIPCIMSMLTRFVQFTSVAGTMLDNNKVEKEGDKSKNAFTAFFSSKK